MATSKKINPNKPPAAPNKLTPKPVFTNYYEVVYNAEFNVAPAELQAKIKQAVNNDDYNPREVRDFIKNVIFKAENPVDKKATTI